MTKWKLVPVEPDEPTLSAMHEKMYDVRAMKWHDGMAAVYMAGVNAAPPPPKLSDERILSIGKKFLDRGEYPFEGLQPWVYSFARAIEREILGGGEK